MSQIYILPYFTRFHRINVGMRKAMTPLYQIEIRVTKVFMLPYRITRYTGKVVKHAILYQGIKWRRKIADRFAEFRSCTKPLQKLGKTYIIIGNC